MRTREYLLYGRTGEAALEDARKKGICGRVVVLGWPPLRDSRAWERLRELRAGERTTFLVRLFPDALQTTKAYDEYLERYFRFVSDAAEFDAAQTIHGLTATNRTCKSCSSHVAVEHVRGEACPVCGSDLRSNTVQKTISRWRERIAKVRAQGEGEAEKAGWLGSWAARTVDGWEFDEPEALRARELLRKYDSEAFELAQQTGTEALYLAEEDYELLCERAQEQGVNPAELVHAWLA